MEFGILGFLVLLFMHIYPIIVAKKQLRIFIFLFMLISVSQLMTDIYISGLSPLTFTLILVVFFNSEINSNRDLEVKEIA